MDFYWFYFGFNLFKFIYVGCEFYGLGNLVNGISIGLGFDFVVEKMIVSFVEIYFFVCIVKNGGYMVNGIEIWIYVGNELWIYFVFEGYYVGCDLFDGDKGEEG